VNSLQERGLIFIKLLKSEARLAVSENRVRQELKIYEESEQSLSFNLKKCTAYV
jgi:hypothetical protein